MCVRWARQKSRAEAQSQISALGGMVPYALKDGSYKMESLSITLGFYINTNLMFASSYVQWLASLLVFEIGFSDCTYSFAWY